jgi:anion transporter
MSQAVVALIILCFCIFLFITEWLPSAVTACLGCLLMVLFKVSTIRNAFSGFSSEIVLLVFGALIVGDALFETGTARLIGKSVIRLSRDDERLFILFGGLVSAALSMFLANTAVVASFLPIIASVSSISKNMNRKNLTMSVTFGAMYGGAATLVGSTTQLTAQAIVQEMAGFSYGMWDYTKVGSIMIAIYMLYALFIGYPLGKKIWGGRDDIADDAAAADPHQHDAALEKPVDKRKVVTMVLIFSFMVISFMIGYFSVGMTSLITAMLCILFKCTDQNSIIKNMNWSVIFFLAGCLGIASGITEAGVGNLIADGVVRFFGTAITPWQLFVVLVPLTLLISNFITNSTAVIIVLPVAISICQKFGYSCLPFGIAIVYAASLACSTPLAHAQIAMTLVAGYKFIDYLKYTIILTILTLISILVFVPMFFPLV